VGEGGQKEKAAAIFAAAVHRAQVNSGALAQMARSDYRTTSSDEANHDDDHRDDQKDVNQTAGDMERQEAQRPKDDQHERECE
jgi:hypothetical protein